MKTKIINVLLPLPFNHTFQYLCKDKDKVELGDFVSVPFKDKILDFKSSKLIPQNLGAIESVNIRYPLFSSIKFNQKYF